MSDAFAHHSKGLESPADIHYAIVPDDDNDLPRIPRVLYCIGAGQLVVRDMLGTQIAYSLEVGDKLELRARRILTASTATVVGWE